MILTQDQRDAITDALGLYDATVCFTIERDTALEGCEECSASAGFPCDVDCERLKVERHRDTLREMLE